MDRNLMKMTSITSSNGENVRKIDYPEWVINMNQFIKKEQVYRSGKLWSIYEVPKSLKEVQKNAFEPKIISIGPFHHHKDTMQDHKKRYLLRLLGGKLGEVKGSTSEDSPLPRRNVSLEELFKAMKELELETKERYSKDFDDDKHDDDKLETNNDNKHETNSDKHETKKKLDFVSMMVMDSCFVIELLRLYNKSLDPKNAITDPIFTTPWMLTTLRRDLIMLENQLPFFVLRKLFDMTRLEDDPSLELLAVTFFNPLLERELKHVKPQIEINPEEDYRHLLDLFRLTFISTTKKDVKQMHKKAELNKHCASDLRDDGFELEKKEGELINIDFKEGNLLRRGTLQMPQLIIDDDSLPLFLNFVAYEQSHDKAYSYFSNYFMFLDSLINTTKDVETLRECDVLYHEMGSDAKVFDLVINLCREIVYDPYRCHLSVHMKKMNAYWDYRHKYRWLVGWRKLWKNSETWLILSVLAAFLLLAFTGIQTVYALISYYEPTEGMALRVSSS